MDTGLLFLHTSFKIEDETKTEHEFKAIIEDSIKKYNISVLYSHELELTNHGKQKDTIRNKIKVLFEHSKKIGLDFVI